jgi:tRNA nucleotidyltransferase (CCA-adding enzyme)
MDAFAAERTGEEREDLVVGFAILCHDFGKPATTRIERGRITSPGHEALGGNLSRTFLAQMTDEEALIDEVVPLVEAHLAPVELFDARAGDAAVRRLGRRVHRIDRLLRVARADQQGRPPRKVDCFPAEQWLRERAQALEVQVAAPKPIIMGRHLVDLGLTPGPHFRSILEGCYAAQIDGEFATLKEGLEYVKAQIIRRNLKG